MMGMFGRVPKQRSKINVDDELWQLLVNDHCHNYLEHIIILYMSGMIEENRRLGWK